MNTMSQISEWFKSAKCFPSLAHFHSHSPWGRACEQPRGAFSTPDPSLSWSRCRRGYRVIHKIWRMRKLGKHRKHRQNPRWRLWVSVTPRHCRPVYKVLFSLASWKMQNRGTLHQTLQQRVYGGFPPGALLKRARGMWGGDWWESADVFDISAVWSAGFDTITQKFREIYRVFRRFFYSHIFICSNLIFFNLAVAQTYRVGINN